MQNRRDILSPVIKTGKVDATKSLAVLKQRDYIISKVRGRGAWMPTDELDMAQIRPLREEDVKSGGRSSINGEGGD